MRNRMLVAALLVCAACGGDTTTPPGPPGPAHGAWLANGPGTVNLQGDGITTEPSVNYSLSDPGWSDQTWTLKTTAPRAATVTLPFTYTGFHAWAGVTVFVEAFVAGPGGTQVDTVIEQGPVYCCSPPSGGFNLADSATFKVAKGDEYGFHFGGSNFDTDNRLQGTFSITSTP